MQIRIVQPLARLLCALVAGLAAMPVFADRPLSTLAGADMHAPAVAHDAEHDRYLIVYQTTFGRLEGQIRSGDGGVIDPFLELLPHYPGLEYRDPRVTYKPHNDLWLMTAISEDAADPFSTRLTVSAFDVAGELVWTYDVPGVGDTVRTPDIMADTFPDDCCIMVVWKEGYGTIYGRQIDAAGAFVGPRTAIHRDRGLHSEHAFNPRIAYGDLRDDFLVVYQRTYRGRLPRVDLQAVQPVSGRLGFHRSSIELHEDPRTSYGEKFSGGPDVAWDPVGQRYMVAWREDIYLRGVLYSPDGWMASNPLNLFVDDTDAGDILAGGIPEVIAATGEDRFLVSHARSLDGVFGAGRPAWWMEGWWVDFLGRVSRAPVSTWWYEERAGISAGGWSAAAGEAFIVWERDEPSTGPISPPPRDLYWETVTPP